MFAEDDIERPQCAGVAPVGSMECTPCEVVGAEIHACIFPCKGQRILFIVCKHHSGSPLCSSDSCQSEAAAEIDDRTRGRRRETQQLEGGLLLEVRDDGVGFDVADPGNRRSLGLVSMEERVRLLGSRLDLWSCPGRGTSVSCATWWPGPRAWIWWPW